MRGREAFRAGSVKSYPGRSCRSENRSQEEVNSVEDLCWRAAHQTKLSSSRIVPFSKNVLRTWPFPAPIPPLVNRATGFLGRCPPWSSGRSFESLMGVEGVELWQKRHSSACDSART